MKFQTLLALSAAALLTFVVTGCGDGGGGGDEMEGSDEIQVGNSAEAEGMTHTANFIIDDWANPYDPYQFETAEEGNRFIAIDMTIENNTDGDVETSNLYYTLNYGGDSNAEMSFYGGGTEGEDTNLNRFSADEVIAAGGSYNADLLFEVPADSGPADWTLEYDSDFLDFTDDNETASIPMQ